MAIPVFLSYPKPFTVAQEEFLNRVKSYLNGRGIETRTLGTSNYDMNAPLAGIRRLMLESNGLITIAFRRTWVKNATVRLGSDNGGIEERVSNHWLTSPYSHIEPAMAFQLGLPIIIFRETGVIADGLLEKSVLGQYMPEFDVTRPDEYFASDEWNQLIQQWEAKVRNVVETKGYPPRLY